MEKSLVILLTLLVLFVLPSCGTEEQDPTADQEAKADTETVKDSDSVKGNSDETPDIDTYDPTQDPAWRAADDDGDGIPNGIENPDNQYTDTDGDGISNYQDDDSDGDGLSDREEAGEDPANPADRDKDGIPDYIDRDSDNDGLSDKKEGERGTNPYNKDTDDDGSDDLAEIIYNENTPGGADPLDPNKKIPDGIFYVVLPYNGLEEVERTLTFSTVIESIDVQIVLDISGSMSDEIEEVSQGVKTQIIDRVKEEFNMEEFASFGVSRISWNGTSKFLRQKQTFDTNKVKDAVDNSRDDAFDMAVGANELHSEVLYQLAAGEEFHGQASLCPPLIGCGFIGDAVINIAPPDCSGEIGSVGHGCFRKKSMPIFILITDEEHEDCDPDGKQDLSECFWHAGSGLMNGHTFNEAIAVMNGIGSKFIGINTWHEKTADGESNGGIDPQPDMEYLAERTGSLNKNGKPFIYHTSTPTGEGMPDQIAQAIIDLTTFLDMDVTTGKMSDETCDGRSAADFVKSSSTVKAEPPENVEGQDGTTFFSVKQGAVVTFDVRFYNDFCQNHSSKPVTYQAYVTVLGNGSYLSNRLVTVIVPESEEQ